MTKSLYAHVLSSQHRQSVTSIWTYDYCFFFLDLLLVFGLISGLCLVSIMFSTYFSTILKRTRSSKSQHIEQLVFPYGSDRAIVDYCVVGLYRSGSIEALQLTMSSKKFG